MKKTISTIVLSVVAVLFLGQNTSANSVTDTTQNYIWISTSPSSIPVHVQSQGNVSIKNYLYSGIGNQFLARIQSSFNTGVNQLSDNTVLTVRGGIKTSIPYNDTTNPSISVRLNVSGQSSSSCSGVSLDPTVMNGNLYRFDCTYIFDTSAANLSTIWVDLGFLSAENGVIVPLENIFFIDSNPWWEYLEFDIITGLSNGDQAIISALDRLSDSYSVISMQNHIDSQNLQNAIEEQSTNDQNRYDQEKEEEAERENQINESLSTDTPTVNLPSLDNPFGNSQCVTITTVPRWLHLEPQQACPQFSQEIRNVGNSIIGLLIALISWRLLPKILHIVRGDIA